jgi:hypothetical protein
MRASEFIDRISVQNLKMKPIVKKNLDESTSESKTAKFNEISDDQKALELSLKSEDGSFSKVP